MSDTDRVFPGFENITRKTQADKAWKEINEGKADNR